MLHSSTRVHFINIYYFPLIYIYIYLELAKLIWQFIIHFPIGDCGLLLLSGVNFTLYINIIFLKKEEKKMRMKDNDPILQFLLFGCDVTQSFALKPKLSDKKSHKYCILCIVYCGSGIGVHSVILAYTQTKQ